MKYCNLKRIYATEEEALEIANYIRDKSKLRPYRCEICGYWHNSTAGKRKKKYKGKFRHKNHDADLDMSKVDESRIKKALTNGYGVFRNK